MNISHDKCHAHSYCLFFDKVLHNFHHYDSSTSSVKIMFVENSWNNFKNFVLSSLFI